MRSPVPFIVQKVVHPSSQHQEDDSNSFTSASSRITSSTRGSRLPSCTTRKATSSFVGGCNYGVGGDTNLRVVTRIRPVSATANEEGSRVVFLEIDENNVSSPTKSNANTHRESSDSYGSVANLAAKFNSPNNKALMPCTDVYTATTTPTELFSPPNNTSKTPLHANKNNGKILPVRQSFIQSPSTTKEIEEIIEKRAAENSKVSQSVFAGTEKFDFDAVST